ncbi:2-dehydro-3-deoxyphosphooctonate aldolase [Marinirhabdus gelatinilytica]|uniref:2-dehydro-3-deoxyphosphooctonate aldolase n=1 Tax=Marinirhabdus gelatinilytica TaxID=1703343 RepID=A0A370QEZ2_9FLAO|nr:2-dehydro-3-deoxyphosphooctonate aldolase [Marinirhabdus gelatinilytica]RDK86942.1 hypothetical protein C8D94_102120 [Marinirhabdus gelatinilytica]
MKKILLLLIVLLCLACGAKKPTILSSSSNPMATSLDYEPFIDVSEYSTDKEYGLVEDKPIKVGEKSAINQRRYIASLAGPEGQVLSFYRVGSCCPYASENGLSGTALVDVYSVTYKGLKKPIMLYISFYDFETLMIPEGFTKREI